MSLFVDTSDTPFDFCIDGSQMEGGGQVLRMSVAIACVLGKTIRIFNIRGKRSKPGLRAQHLCGIEACASLYGRRLTGGRVGSMEVELGGGGAGEGWNGEERIDLDAQTAGAISLVLQAVLPAVLFHPKAAGKPATLTVRGGTDVDFAPLVAYIGGITCAYLAMMGVHVEVECVRRGYFPRGGGEVRVTVQPLAGGVVRPIGLQQRARVHAEETTLFHANVPAAVVNDAIACVSKRASAVEVLDYSRQSGGASVLGALVCARDADSRVRFGCSKLLKVNFSKRGRGGGRVEVGGLLEAIDGMQRTVASGSALDEHMLDQLIMFMVVADGTSTVNCGRGLGGASDTGGAVLECYERWCGGRVDARVLPRVLPMHMLTGMVICEEMVKCKWTVRLEVREGASGGPLPEGNDLVVECEGIAFRLA